MRAESSQSVNPYDQPAPDQNASGAQSDGAVPDGNTQASKLKIGSDVLCADKQKAGRLDRVVLDPRTGRVTHVVVRRDRSDANSALVPIDLVASEIEAGDTIVLTLTKPDFDRLPAYDPAAHAISARGWQGANTSYAAGDVVFALGGNPSSLGNLVPRSEGRSAATLTQPSVDLSRATEVVCDDGPAGHVELLLLDPVRGAATHAVVRRAWLDLVPREDLVVPLAWARRISSERIELAVSRADLDLLPRYRPDQELLGEVYEALSADPRFQSVELYTLHAEVENGVVLLKGNVRTTQLKSAAEEIVGKVQGVIGVDNRLVADPDLEQAVTRALEEAPGIQVGVFEVEVLLGAVTLRGRVRTAEEREEAARVVREVPGVQSVANQIEVESD